MLIEIGLNRYYLMEYMYVLNIEMISRIFGEANITPEK